MRVLLHICCAPCACASVEALTSEGLEVMGLWYNPNIHPYAEYARRRDTAVDWAERVGLKLIVQDEYDPEAWVRQVAWREAQRCRLCYHQRLTRAGQVARKGGFDAFSSTLLYSVRQKHELIRQAGEAAGHGGKTRFLYRDLRPLWRRGVELSLEMGLYRQDYCGCLLSERDRRIGAPPKGPDAAA